MAKKAKVAPVSSGKTRGKRKLGDEAVLAIVKARALGEKVADLAQKHSVTPATIYSLLKGKTYSWLTGIGGPALAAA